MRHSLQPLYGWKIAATSLAGQQHIAVDGPLAGRLLAEQVRPMGGSVSLAGNRMRVVELEFAFRMGRDLPPRVNAYSADEVMAAVATLHPAIEIPDSRFTDFTRAGMAQLIADNACAHLFMLGPGLAEGWQGLDLAAFAVDGSLQNPATGRSLACSGQGANVLGDPRLAMAWLANELSSLGISLRAGEVVTTGTCVVPMAVLPGDTVTGDFGCFGKVSAHFE
jgi:2-keto-4-pentenoate hydratase